MRLRARRLLPVATVLVLLPAAAAANPIPFLTTSVHVSPQINQGCSTTDLLWSPNCTAGADHLIFRATVTFGDTGEPFPDCELRLEVSGWFQSHFLDGSGGHGVVCGPAERTATTDPSGAVEFGITGGGCGVAGLHWRLSALLVDPPMLLYEAEDTLCVKSYDMDGSGSVNFFDTFKYLPYLHGYFGYCGDLAQCSSENLVNFFDTFRYLPHLSAADNCGSDMVRLTDVEAGFDPESECPLDPW